MSKRRTAATITPKSNKKKALQKSSIHSFLGLGNHASLTKLHVGKRILLSAVGIYGKNRFPEGEEDFLFMYSVESINNDCKTATIEYESKFIEEGGSEWQCYPEVDGDAYPKLNNYQLKCFKDDHDLYNTYLGKVNKKANDETTLNRRREEEQKRSSVNDVSDIIKKIQHDGMSAYDVLLLEFEPTGTRVEHIVTKGAHMGKATLKQGWKHKFSDYTFVWHMPYGKTKFETSRLWKVARVVVKLNNPGSTRLSQILKLGGMTTDGTGDGEDSVAKRPREDDMEKRVLAVMAMLSSKIPLSVFSNTYFQQYIHSLDPMHRPPHHLEVNRIIEVLMDVAVFEVDKLLDERRNELRHGFLSMSTDFWTDPNRRESFGAIILNLVGMKYEMKDGRTLFMSRDTAKRAQEELMTGRYVLDILECPVNFERVEWSKTIDNVFEWISASTNEFGIKPSDLNQVSADGAGNAIGSVAEYESRTRKFRGHDVELDVCIAHQNERAGHYASGTAVFAEPANADLGVVLKKSHELQVSINRSKERRDVYSTISKKNGRKRCLLPKPGNETRWNSRIDETTRANIIMGDICQTMKSLLSEGGMDHHQLTEDEKATGNIDAHTYTAEEKMILRQYEFSAMPAKNLSKFLQTRGNNRFSYLLYEVQLALQKSRYRYLFMPVDVSHHRDHEDLTKRGPLCAVAVESGDELLESIREDTLEECEMDEVVATYRDVYASDLGRRLRIDEAALPSAYSVSTLFNPLFGLKPMVVGSGLMTNEQYDFARKTLLKRMQDEFDATNPVPYDDSSSVDSLDGSIHPVDNENHTRAENELRSYEAFKKRKYHPEVNATSCLHPRDEDDQKFRLCFGPLKRRGEDLPSGKNLADYMDKKGRMDLLRFTTDHQSLFPTIWTLVQREASRQTEEVGCERFFGLSGYVSSPRRVRLGIRNYERIAMLADILQKVYIDPSFVAREYLRRCKEGAWKLENTKQSLKCFNLERMIDADIFNLTEPAYVEMEEYVGDDSCGYDSEDDDEDSS